MDVQRKATPDDRSGNRAAIVADPVEEGAVLARKPTTNPAGLRLQAGSAPRSPGDAGSGPPALATRSTHRPTAPKGHSRSERGSRPSRQCRSSRLGTPG